ncbi:Os02g0651100 [Oryza sativa Japonica Group]|uniref:Os02g0651100 protein n=1 Tax=Oryza sativa subsp. japonica TaxID=39947 RepID=C7IYA6_ORYSJ|nr:Os02g0651100 [Oryza sativa Japonica Group]|eukprot:NP_001173097.1 Os02g0651100 [Oryza sativa Japonica Group]
MAPAGGGRRRRVAGGGEEARCAGAKGCGSLEEEDEWAWILGVGHRDAGARARAAGVVGGERVGIVVVVEEAEEVVGRGEEEGAGTAAGAGVAAAVR